MSHAFMLTRLLFIVFRWFLVLKFCTFGRYWFVKGVGQWGENLKNKEKKYFKKSTANISSN
jgi:hypothetical protein